MTVTLLDGIVLARSVFEHSINYRSVVVLGTATPVTDPDEKNTVLEAFTEKLLPGRWADARQPTRKELKATGSCHSRSTKRRRRCAPVPGYGDTPDAELESGPAIFHSSCTPSARGGAGAPAGDPGSRLRTEHRRHGLTD